MLALKVEYLTGIAMATAHDDPNRSTPEWPPHPDRLYSALVAAAGHLPDAKLDSSDPTKPKVSLPARAQAALKWMAEQCWNENDLVAPEIYASEAHYRLTSNVHMPSNPDPSEIPDSLRISRRANDLVKARKDKEKSLRNILPVHRKKTALPIPAVIPDEPVVYFVWRNANPNGHLDTLRDICDHITCLGRSRSLVRVTLMDDPPEPTHTPDTLGQVQLRVPARNRLEELKGFYERKGGKPDPSPSRRYRNQRDRTDNADVIPALFERMYVFRPTKDDQVLPATSTVKLASRLRMVLIACVEVAQERHDLPQHVPDIVHGHGAHPHCAFVALPFVHPWQRHADGAIKGLAVLVPRDASQSDLMALALGLEELQKNGLGIPGIGTWNLAEVSQDAPPLRALDAATWRGPSRLWTTTTPMEFGHFPKRNRGGEAKVVLDSLKMAGINPDHVAEIAVGRHSPLHGAPPSWQFKPHQTDKAGSSRRLLRHVTLRFDRPVAGPLLLGAKRYFGLGLMMPLRER